MATSKTLAPTNVTISIPAMTDAPNASVLSNCIDKEADAINTLNSQLGGLQIIQLTKSVSSGFFKITTADGVANNKLLIVQNCYVTSSHLVGLNFTVQHNGANGYTVYVRKVDGTNPTDGTDVVVNILSMSHV